MNEKTDQQGHAAGMAGADSASAHDELDRLKRKISRLELAGAGLLACLADVPHAIETGTLQEAVDAWLEALRGET